MVDHKKYRVYEGSIHMILETDDLEEAERVRHEAHWKKVTDFHELYRWNAERGQYDGIRQLAPDDCALCGRGPGNCDHGRML